MSCDQNPLPASFVSRDIDHAVIGNYMKKKYPALCQCLGKPDTLSIYCSIKVFEDLITTIAGQPDAAKMKMYFASYTTFSGKISDLPVSYRGTTTLIFVAVDGTNTDVPAYFVIHPLNGVVDIPQTLANDMVLSFQKDKATLLTQIAAVVRPDFIESKATWIELPKLNDPELGFLGELQCQGAAGVTIHFGAYPAPEMFPHDGKTSPVGLQLTLILLPTQTTPFKGEDYYYHFDLEDTIGFAGRSAIQPLNVNMIAGGNTFNPCPPATTGCNPSIGQP